MIRLSRKRKAREGIVKQGVPGKLLESTRQYLANSKLLYALATVDTDRVDEALQDGANVNVQDARGNTPLMIIADMELGERSKYEIEKLLDNKADVNVSDKEGYTALILAAQNPQPSFVKTLLESGANVNAYTCGREEPRTALDFALQELYDIKELIASYKLKGLNPGKDEIEKRQNTERVIELLKEHGGKTYKELHSEN